jgi:two-component system nitrogen regulation sensor histidine kinase NtrY
MVSRTAVSQKRTRLRSLSRSSQVALGVGALAALSGCVTYALLSGLTPYTPTRTGLAVLLLVNLSLVLSLSALIAWRLVRLWAERRSGRAGAKLHVRLVTWFSAIAVVPVILVAVFAAVTLNLGMEAWFSDRVKTALGSAVNVAQVYVKEHEASILGDIRYIADAIQNDPQLFDADKHVRVDRLFTKLGTVTQNRGLQAAYILDSKGHILGSTKQKSVKDPPPPKPSDIAAARESVVLDTPDDGTVTALVRLPALNDAYLEVVRAVDPKVFGYYLRTKAAVGEYNRLDKNRSEVALLFAALYAVVSLAVLLAAIWLGFWAANRLVRPISHLIDAAEKVSEGDLSAHVPITRDDDELGMLGEAFNRMTDQLSAQHKDLVEAGRQIDIRRRFTETVLSGVSAGVIGLDGDGHITIINRAAARLMDSSPEDMEDAHYAEAIPELAALIRRAIAEPVGRAGGEVTIRRGGKTRTLSVQVSSEPAAHSFVVTFDDITDLVSAQRTAAWADVARRIAHEIKNPLTPIQLSAERLKRKYSSEIVTDPDVFRQCTDTIVRQVGDIGRMVDEFSSFARMPTPVMRRENAQELVQQAMFLQRVGNPNITFTTKLPRDPIHFEGDGRLVSQALTNVLKNAGEGIQARIAKGDDEPGMIEIALDVSGTPDEGGTFTYRITDNGIGLPSQDRHRLTEPYITTRAKGTGLGLAIVRKVVEDHGGNITLSDVEEGSGAQVALTFPFRQKQEKASHNEGSNDEQERIADRV